MSRLTERELRRRLTSAAPEPPAGLLEKLQGEIPEELKPLAETRRPRRAEVVGEVRGRWYRSGAPVWKIAAAVVLAAGAGWLASRTGRELPAPGSARQAAAREETDAPAAESKAPGSGLEAVRQEAFRDQVGRGGGESPPAPAASEAVAVAPKRFARSEEEGASGSAGSGLREDLQAEDAAGARPGRPEPVARPLETERRQAREEPRLLRSSGSLRSPVPQAVPLPAEPFAPPVSASELKVRALAKVGTGLPGAPVFLSTAKDRFSSFGLDVGTGSYTLVRRWLELGKLPPPEAVRLEEMVNFFDYGDAPPSRGNFALAIEGAPSAYGAPGLQLLRLAFVAREKGSSGSESVARDARVQVELNPETVAEYRLLGFENRAVADETFRRDDLDAGEIGAGHTMTALYELRLQPGLAEGAPLARVRLRWWSVGEERMWQVEETVRVSDLARSWGEAPRGLRLAALVAELAEVLGRSPALPRRDLETLAADARQLASGAYAGDPEVAALVKVIDTAAALERGREKLAPGR